MGYQVGNSCFGTLDEAVPAVCAGVRGMTAAGSTYCRDPGPTWNGWAGYTLVTNGADGESTRYVTEQLQPCDAAAVFTDLQVLFGLFLGVIAVIWAVKNFVLVHITGSH